MAEAIGIGSSGTVMSLGLIVAKMLSIELDFASVWILKPLILARASAIFRSFDILAANFEISTSILVLQSHPLSMILCSWATIRRYVSIRPLALIRLTNEKSAFFR